MPQTEKVAESAALYGRYDLGSLRALASHQQLEETTGTMKDVWTPEAMQHTEQDLNEYDMLAERGYVPLSKTALELLFSVVSKSYQTQSLIVTSNLEFGRRSEIFGDHRLTAALVDRLVHHSHIFIFSGKSYRLGQTMETQTNITNPSTKPVD